MGDRGANDLSTLLKSLEALRNARALALLAATSALAGFLIMIGASATGRSGDPFGLVFAILLATIVALIGINATGLVLLDQVDGQAGRDILGAILDGVRAALSVAGALIVLAAAFAVIVLAAYLLSWPALIPGIGGLFALLLAGPTLAATALACALLAFVGPLILVAVWHGDDGMPALLRALAILVKRPFAVFLRFLVLGIILIPVALLLDGALTVAGGLVSGFYRSDLLGRTPALAHAGVHWNVLTGTGASGLTGAGVSMSLVWYLSFSLIGVVCLLGSIFVYRAVSEGVNPGTPLWLEKARAWIAQKIARDRDTGGTMT